MGAVELKINLDRYRRADEHVFAGRDRGAEIRDAVGPAAMNAADRIEVLIPDDVYAVNSTFLVGLLGDAIRRCRDERRDPAEAIVIPKQFGCTFRETIRRALSDGY